MRLVRSKRGEVMSETTLKWIGAIGILAIASLAVWNIMKNVLS
ncbi:MAG: hypothetical protein V1888_01545 [archaeon]